MKKISQILLVATYSITQFSCSSLNSTANINRETLYQPSNQKDIPGTLYSITSDATRRVGFVFVMNDGNMKALLEPPPDAVAAAISTLSAKATVSKVDAGVTDALTKTNDLLAARGTAVELQRGQLFQLSLLYFSGGITGTDVKAEFDKIIDSSDKLALAEVKADSAKASNQKSGVSKDDSKDKSTTSNDDKNSSTSTEKSTVDSKGKSASKSKIKDKTIPGTSKTSTKTETLKADTTSK